MPNEDFQIIENIDFDPMAILHGEGTLPGQPIVKIGKDDDGGADDGKPNPTNVVKPVSKVPTSLELTDEMLEEGFRKAKGGAAADDKKPENDNGGKGADDDKNQKPIVKGADDPTNPVALHYKMMVEAGEWEEIEGFDGSDEKYEEAKIHNGSAYANKLADSYFDQAFKENPDGRDSGVKLFNHLRQGGTIRDFLELYSSDEINFEGLDDKDEEVANQAARDVIDGYYTAIGWKRDKINARIQSLDKLGRLVDEAKDVEEPFKDLTSQQQLAHRQQLDQQTARSADERKKNTQAIKKMIDENLSFGDLKLYNNPKEKATYEEYVFKVNEETGKTGISDDINNGLRDPKFLLFTALAYKNKLHEKPDAFSGDGKGSDTKAISKVRQTLQEALLNKGISHNKDVSSVNKTTDSSGYQFDLENALVIQ